MTEITAPGTYTVRLPDGLSGRDARSARIVLEHMNHTDCSSSAFDEATGVWTVTFNDFAVDVVQDLRDLASGILHAPATVERVPISSAPSAKPTR
jgi:hypothetical protein